jgi:anti-sigma B factor antagonist
MNDAPLKIEIKDGSSANVKIVEFDGPVTLNNIFHIKDHLKQVETPVVILDLTKVNYMDSAGIGVMINAHVSTEKRGAKLGLVGVGERPKAVMEVTRVLNVFHIFGSIAEAEKELLA